MTSNDKGVLILYTQSADINKYYSTGLNGTYKLTLLDLKLITQGLYVNAVAFQVISDTIKIDKGNDNTNLKIFLRVEMEERQDRMKLQTAVINNWVGIRYSSIGAIGTNINALGGGYNIIMKIEYEKVG